MALVRVAQYSSTPTVVGDYQAQNAPFQAFTNQLMTQQFILDSGTDSLSSNKGATSVMEVHSTLLTLIHRLQALLVMVACTLE